MAQAFLNGVSYDQSNMNVAQLIERTVTEIEIPEGVTVIGQGAFMGCKSVTRVDIPEGVVTINAQGFRDCENLKEINFPQSLKYLYNEAVMNCFRLKKLIFPPKVTDIPITCASSCWNMTEVICEGDIVNVSAHSFQYCNKCEKYDFTNCTSVPVLQNTNAFINIPSYCKILVPAALYDAWIVATNWSQYADYIQPVVDIPKMEIPDHVSEGLQIVGSSVMGRGSCTDSVVVINQGDNVECIGMDAFWEDQDIEELYVLGSIVSIDNGVCSSSSLKRLYMENVSTICSITLNADALEYVRFSKNISYIGESSLQSKNESVIYDFSAFEGDEIPALYFYTSGDSLSSGVIFVPASRCEEWKTATNWSYYADKIFPV